MENQLPQAQGRSVSLEISQEEKLICMELYHVNHLLAYPLTDVQIIDWGKCIARLKPDITAEQVKIAIEEMTLGVIPYNTKEGLQNIFRAIKMIRSPYYRRGEGIIC